MLLDPVSLELAPRAGELMVRLDGDERFKLELPASQIEILTAPKTSVPEAITALEAGRRMLAERADGLVAPAGAGVCPLGSGVGELNDLPRYRRTLREYGWIAKRQLVCAVQVHVSVGAAEPALAVYNEARAYLPCLAALAANGAFYGGRDTGLASIRPKLAGLLPRQGVPPAFDTWEDYAAALRWGADTGALPDPGTWWWELRLHPRHGTLEFRVPDTQASIGDAGAIAGVVHALVAWLAQRHAAGERPVAAPTWRIEENRWSACRYGVEGTMVNLQSGERRTTRACLADLLRTLGPTAAGVGCTAELERAAALVQRNGAIAQRQAAASGGAKAVARWLTECFLDPCPG